MSTINFRQSTKVDLTDSFYEHLVYENLENICDKYFEIQNGPILNDTLKKQLHQEIENLGVILGRRIIDIITKDALSIPQTQMEMIKYIC